MKKTMSITDLKNKIEEANKAYRSGNPIITDFEYDALVDQLAELAPHDDLLLQIGGVVPDTRKEKLPVQMASLNKVKTMDEIRAWFKSKGIPSDAVLCLTPKYDGNSLVVCEEKGNAWTRGNGIEGQRSDEHFKKISSSYINDNLTSIRRSKIKTDFTITFGEVIISRKNWEKYTSDYSNARNMVAGLLNSKTATSELEDCDYIRYGTNSEMDKDKQLSLCNSMNKVKVPAVLVTIAQIDDDYLHILYSQWKKDYEIDGIVIEANDATLRAKLGRESNTNPAYARAYKGNFEEVKQTTIVDINWAVSKKGLVKPVGVVNPVNLDGANVTFVTLYNWRYVVQNRLGKGAVVNLRRSGGVIPEIVGVVKTANKVAVPTYCPSCGGELQHGDVELICDNLDCEGQQINSIISFFNIMDVDNMGEGNITAFFNAGFNTVGKILAMSKFDMEGIDKFGKRKAEIVYDAIHSKMQDVDLSKLQHASGCFGSLGSKKLKLVEHMYTSTTIPTVSDLLVVEGFAEKSAHDYIDGMVCFREFIKGLPITIKSKEKKKMGGYFSDMVFCFTGFRNKEWESLIENGGGEITSSVTKKTTHLIMKEKGSGSSKEKKALEMGIKVMDAKEFEEAYVE